MLWQFDYLLYLNTSFLFFFIHTTLSSLLWVLHIPSGQAETCIVCYLVIVCFPKVEKKAEFSLCGDKLTRWKERGESMMEILHESCLKLYWWSLPATKSALQENKYIKGTNSILDSCTIKYNLADYVDTKFPILSKT